MLSSIRYPCHGYSKFSFFIPYLHTQGRGDVNGKILRLKLKKNFFKEREEVLMLELRTEKFLWLRRRAKMYIVLLPDTIYPKK